MIGWQTGFLPLAQRHWDKRTVTERADQASKHIIYFSFIENLLQMIFLLQHCWHNNKNNNNYDIKNKNKNNFYSVTKIILKAS